MTRGHGWTFLDVGRRLERASSLVGLLSGALKCEQRPDLLWEPVLAISDSVMSHRRRYFGEIEPRGVLELLVSESNNPRSLVFQCDQLTGHAAELPPASNLEGVQQVRARIRELTDAAHAIRPEVVSDPGRVVEPLADLSVRLDELSEMVTQVFFSHTVLRVN
jgi:uncharacterized alpha-E superfamily protein